MLSGQVELSQFAVGLPLRHGRFRRADGPALSLSGRQAKSGALVLCGAPTRLSKDLEGLPAGTGESEEAELLRVSEADGGPGAVAGGYGAVTSLYKPTVAILTAMPAERAAVKHLLEFSGMPFDTLNPNTHGAIRANGGLHPVVLPPPSYGQANTAAAATDVLHKFPTIQSFFFLGVAGGVEPAKVGDVVVSRFIVQLDSGKYTRQGDFEFRGHNLTAPAPSLLKYVDTLQSEMSVDGTRWTGWARDFLLFPRVLAGLRRQRWPASMWPTSAKRPPSVLVGTIGTSNAIIDDSHVRDKAKLEHRVLALETEAEGLSRAASRADRPRPYLIIRGISDLSDGNRDEKRDSIIQPYSAHVAAAYLGYLLEAIPPFAELEDMFPPRTAVVSLPSTVATAATVATALATPAMPAAPARDVPQARRPASPLTDSGRRPSRPAAEGPAPFTESGDVAALRALIESADWVVGAVNFDEDLHFSTFYTRQSCRKYLPPEFREFGYKSLIAVYEDFNEAYFIPREDCRRVAQALLDKIRQDPDWLQEIIQRIYQLGDELSKVFPYTDDVAPFAAMSDLDLLKIYEAHNRCHMALYQVARIPEALDRGMDTFSNYLRSYLKEHAPHLANDNKELNRLFNTLTYPEVMSPAAREMGEFQDLLKAIQAQVKGHELLASGAKRALLRMPPDLLSQIAEHRNKWRFWGYHGLGTRTVRDLNYYIQRMAFTLEDRGDSFPSSEEYSKRLEQAEKKRQAAFKDHGVDHIHQLLFRLHSRLGIAKLYRRHVQLRNFCYLDQLLAEVARRKACPEAEVRCLLPEEVEDLLRTGRPVKPAERSRVQLAVHVLDGENETVLAGADLAWVRDELNRRSKIDSSTTLLHGTPVCEGVARGRCKILIRKEDLAERRFHKGDIIVSESMDPDLYDLIPISGGVITEAGGVTSHVAVVCRECGRPAISGVANLLQAVKDDDFVILNADEGYVSVVNPSERKWTLDEPAVLDAGAKRVGSKAYNLSKMLHAGLNVPHFFVVPLDTVAREVGLATPDGAGGQWEALHKEVLTALEYLGGAMFVVRSSAMAEDTADRSHAGEYDTWSCIERQDVPVSVVRQIESMVAASGQDARGSVIVQEMILGDVSGVCFTTDPVSGDQDRLILEAVPGGNDALTDGRVVPVRYTVDKPARSVVKEESGGHWQGVVSNELLQGLLRAVDTVQETFGRPQDIEWTVKNDEIWILQSRPITTAKEGLKADETRRAAPRASDQARDIVSLYSAYRVNPYLRMHMLRSAAVAALIVDHWSGPPVDRQTLLLTMLIHDIGNIAKVDYDRVTSLFPEEIEQNLGYWKAVQKSARERYGQTDQEITLNIAKEVGVPARVLTILAGKTFVRNEDTLASDDWELKIAAYSDQRTGPTGILPLLDRLREAKERYKGVPLASVNDPRFERLVQCGTGIESQLRRFLTVSPEAINDDAIKPYLEEVRRFNLPATADGE